MSARHVPDHIRRAAVADYYRSEQTAARVAARYGIPRSTFSAWVSRRDDLALSGGRWTFCPRRRIQVWERA